MYKTLPVQQEKKIVQYFSCYKTHHTSVEVKTHLNLERLVFRLYHKLEVAFVADRLPSRDKNIVNRLLFSLNEIEPSPNFKVARIPVFLFSFFSGREGYETRCNDFTEPHFSANCV